MDFVAPKHVDVRRRRKRRRKSEPVVLFPISQISLADMIDGDWTIGKERADIAGKILADALLNREQVCLSVCVWDTPTRLVDQSSAVAQKAFRGWLSCKTMDLILRLHAVMY